MPRPIIGIAYSDSSVRDNEMRIRTYVSRKYYNAIQKVGGQPILLPSPMPECSGGDPADLEMFVNRYLDIVDGLILPGGEDIDPYFQGEDPHIDLGTVNPFRDKFEIELTKKAFETKHIPILGICRGCQIIAVAMGGKIYQDLGGIAKIQHSQKAPRWAVSHQLSIITNSKLATIFGREDITTNSFHHQAVREIPKNFIISAKTNDGIIESIEYCGDRFFLGVQWHPEETFQTDKPSQQLFSAFVSAC